MPDPEMVSRVHRAAATLERAWERWRTRHELTAGPVPSVSSYVGYSIGEPGAHPRVVFGIGAEEAEILAALLDSHDDAGFGTGQELTVRPAATAPPVTAVQPGTAVQPVTAVQPARPRPAETSPGYPYPAPTDGAIRVPLSYQGSGTGAAPAETAPVPGQPGSGRPAWADEAALREADTQEPYPAARLSPAGDRGAAEDAAIVMDDSADADRAQGRTGDQGGVKADGAARGPAVPGDSRRVAAEQSSALRSRSRPGRRPYTPQPVPPRPAGAHAGPGKEPPAVPGARSAPPPHRAGDLAAAAPVHGLLAAPPPASPPPPGPGAPPSAGPDAPAPLAAVPGEDEQPTADVEPVGMVTPDLGMSATIAAELAGWAAGELPGQASAQLAAWAAVGEVPDPASRDPRASSPT